MTKEDKELLLRDLTARLTYGVVCDYDGSLLTDIDSINVIQEEVFGNLTAWYDSWPIEKCKPYLYRLEDVDLDARKEITERCCIHTLQLPNGDQSPIIPVLGVDWLIDFFHEHHVDYRGLIKKGLAIQVTEENNPYKKK